MLLYKYALAELSYSAHERSEEITEQPNESTNSLMLKSMHPGARMP